MQDRNKNFDGLRNGLWLCSLFCVLFYFFNHHYSGTKKDQKLPSYHEWTKADANPVLSEKSTLKFSKPYLPSVLLVESPALFSLHDNEHSQIVFREKLFSQIKILLRSDSYHQYFASGLDDHLLKVSFFFNY